MLPTRPALLVVVLTVLVGAAGGSAVVGAQEDAVTMTVTVENDDGDPVGGATLTATWTGGSFTATTVSNGKAFIDVPEGADVQIAVEHDDYVRNAPLVVRDASAREVSMTVYDKASVTITVEDGSGPVAGATVALRKDGQEVVSTNTDDAGVVESGTVEAGSYTAVVSKSGYFTVERTVEVTGVASTTIPIERGTVTIEVNVTDDHFDPPRPVEGATVNVDGSGSVTTQPTGIGRISVPVNAWAGVSVTKDGYGTAEDSVFVAEEDTQVQVAIQRSPAISVELLNERVVIGERAALTVVDEYGDPVADAAVLVDGEEAARTDDNGQAVLRVESTGDHEVTVQKDSLQATATVVGVEEGEAPTDTSAGVTTEDSGLPETVSELPGFGVEVAVLALVLAVLAARVRRR